MIIGIAGTLGAGKGTVVDYLRSLGFEQYSSSGLLGELVDKEGNPKTREYLAKKATQLQDEYSGGVVEKNYYEKYLKEKPQKVIFEAIHRQTEANFLRSVGGHIVGVDADLEKRYERTRKRGEGEKDQENFEHFREQSRIEDDGGGDAARDNNIRVVIDGADYTIMNNGAVEDLHTQIDEVLRKLNHADNS